MIDDRREGARSGEAAHLDQIARVRGDLVILHIHTTGIVIEECHSPSRKVDGDDTAQLDRITQAGFISCEPAYLSGLGEYRKLTWRICVDETMSYGQQSCKHEPSHPRRRVRS